MLPNKLAGHSAKADRLAFLIYSPAMGAGGSEPNSKLAQHKTLLPPIPKLHLLSLQQQDSRREYVNEFNVRCAKLQSAKCDFEPNKKKPNATLARTGIVCVPQTVS